MNTWIWGPPKWKFLHSLSFSPDAPRHAPVVSQFLNTLSSVLPCKYCRESYRQYVRQLSDAANAPLEQIVSKRHLPRWMYDLHDKVNEKLDKQLAAENAKQSGIRLKGVERDALCRKRQITFECLTKRFVLRPISFCAEDVWEFLIIFSYNMDLTRDHADSCMLQDWHTFFNLMPQVAELAGASASLVAALASVPTLMMSTQSFLAAVVQAQTQYENKPFTSVTVTQVQQLYNYAKASVCKHGSCA